MAEHDNPPWDDPRWRESSDTPWRRKLRRHQGWWRSECTTYEPGPITGGERPVVSMLPRGVGLRPNLLSDEAIAAVTAAGNRLKQDRGPGMIQRDRLERNLLSSQPLCFNLFGHLGSDPESLLPWIRTIDADATSVAAVELEIAPIRNPLGGSAFDAFVTYVHEDGTAAFLGIECKYAEDLAAAQRKSAAQKYIEATAPPRWKSGAPKSLDKPRLRQFWYNTLLMQRVADEVKYGHGHMVVVACSEDEAAKDATEMVRVQLGDKSSMVFSSIEDVLDNVEGHNAWKEDFHTRYLNFGRSGSEKSQ